MFYFGRWKGCWIPPEINQEIQPHQFYNVYDYLIETYYSELKQKLDYSVRTPSVGCFVSYDEEVYHNKENTVDIPEYVLNKPKADRPLLYSTSICTQLIPVKTVFNELLFKSPEVDTNGEDVIYIPEGVETVNCFYSKNMRFKDGTKHDHFQVIVQKLFLLNHERIADKQHLYELILSYIYLLNQRNGGSAKMPKRELFYVVSSAYNRCLVYGVTIELRKQYQFTNPELSATERRSKGLAASQKRKKEISKEIIEMAVNHLKENITPTRIMEFLKEMNIKLGERTVKSYYKEIVESANKYRISNVGITENTAEARDSICPLLYSISICTQLLQKKHRIKPNQTRKLLTEKDAVKLKEMQRQHNKEQNKHTVATIERIRKKFLAA